MASESADVHVAERALARGEAASSVRVAAQRGALTVEVVRPSFCATLVSAVASRASGAIDVIASVGGNPLALCSPLQQGWVVVYEVTIPRVASGLVTVRLFELVGNLPPALRGQARVSVPD
ncbi:MAG: hypothetical protein ABI910_01700 [Gemmatimonadota bacterium]